VIKVRKNLRKSSDSSFG